MRVDTRDVRRGLSEWEAAHSSAWPLPFDVTCEALEALSISAARLNELLFRFVGEHVDVAGVARGLAQAVSPHVDFDDWPFTHTDWAAAASEAGIGADAPLLCVRERYWFDSAPDALYAESGSDLSERIRPTP